MSECNFYISQGRRWLDHCADLTTVRDRLHNRRAYGGVHVRITVVDLVGAQVVQGSRADYCAGRGSCCWTYGAQ